MKKSVSTLLVLSILLSILPTFSLAHQGDVYQDKLTIAKGLTYQTKTEDFLDNDRLQSFAFEYSPNSSVFPIVEYGSKLYGKSDINAVIKNVQNQGYNVYGAINSDFFNTTTGIPTGIVVKNGNLYTSDGMWNGVAFSNDGKAYAGAPNMTMTMTRSEERRVGKEC